MKKLCFLIALFLFGISSAALAQNAGINNDGSEPHPSAGLDVKFPDKGLLIPRISLVNTTSANPVTNPATSLIVYNTATANDVTPGYYSWDGSKWVRFSFFAGGTGTTNYVTKWATNGTLGNSMIFDNGTNVGIGTIVPSAKLDVVGGSIKTDNQLVSTVAAGMPPLMVSSSTQVNNLNADLLDGLNASAFSASDHNHSLTLTGDITGSGNVPGSMITTLGNTGVTQGSYGDSTGAVVPYFTVDAKGRLTAAASRGLTPDDIGAAASTGSESYIQNQDTADQAAGFRITGNGIFNGGNVGIGTTTPTESLEIFYGNLSLKATDNLWEDPGDIVFKKNDDTQVARLWTTDLGMHGFFISGNSESTPQISLIGSTGYVGIGTSAPTAKLEVMGTIKITDGTEGTNKVLTSDASGIASWQTPIPPADAWLLSGNSGTVAGTNFIGTTDATAFDIRTNNALKTRITEKGAIETYNTGGSVFIGEGAGANDDVNWVVDNSNVFVGNQAGYSNHRGQYNTANGYQSLYTNTYGAHNVANGSFSLFKNTTGTGNTAIGFWANYNNTTGTNNTAIGKEAGVNYPNLTNATAIGAGAKVNTSNSLVLGNNVNVGIGTSSPGAKLEVAGRIWQTSTGRSVFIGEGAGAADDLGYHYNAFVGYMAGNSNTTGSCNTAIGAGSLSSNTTGNNNTANGQSSLSTNTTGQGNTASGSWSLFNNTTGNFNTANGTYGLQNNTTGEYNTATGSSSLFSNTTGNFNTANGSASLWNNTTGYQNTASGSGTLHQNTIGNYNTAIGVQALYFNTSGNANTAIGNGSLFHNTTGTGNTVCGVNTLCSNTTGNYNVANGAWALFSNTTGNYNVADGYGALNSNTTGSYNTAIGQYADVNSGNLTNATAIGANATVSASNSLVLGNNANVGIGTSSPTSKLDVNGNIGLHDGALFLRSGGSDQNHGVRYNYTVNGPEFMGYAGFTWRTGESGANEIMRLNNGGLKIKGDGSYPDDHQGGPYNHALYVKNVGTDYGEDGIYIELNTQGSEYPHYSSNNNFITFASAEPGYYTERGRIEGFSAAEAGGWEPSFCELIQLGFTIPMGLGEIISFAANWALIKACTDGGVMYCSGGGDYAEYIERENHDEDYYFGMVVGVKSGKVSLNTVDAEQIMVVSAGPIVLGNLPPAEADEKYFEKIAFMGQVPCLVLGPVSTGDYLIPSGKENGTAIAVSPENLEIKDIKKIIGRSWETNLEEGAKFVLAIVGVKTHELAEIVEKKFAEYDQMNAELEQLKAEMNEIKSVLYNFSLKASTETEPR